MTAISLVSTLNDMNPITSTTSTIDSLKVETPEDVSSEESSISTEFHNDLLLSITSPGLVKRKNPKGSLTPTSLQLLHCAMTSGGGPSSSVSYKSQENQLKAAYHRLKRQESEPITKIPRSTDNIDIRASNEATTTDAAVSFGDHKSSSARRRQIFGSFWDAGATDQSSLKPTPRHNRSSSNVDIASSVTPLPLKPLRSRSKSEGYYFLNTKNDKSHYLPLQWKQLPVSTLPSPMQRLRKSSGGVYPLVQPQSILRRRNNPDEICDLNLTQTLRIKSDVAKCIENVVLEGKTISFRDRVSSSSISSIGSGTNVDDSDHRSTATTITNKRPVVQFDPRITVTELAERDHERVWYTDADLNRFKFETVATARAYLNEHPNQIAIYNQATYDPITKTMRKRALFSLPALSDVTITDLDDEIHPNSHKNASNPTPTSKPLESSNKSLSKHSQNLLSLLAFEDMSLNATSTTSVQTNCTDESSDENTTIQSILIVDHNPWILDLFVRSVKSMFSHRNDTKIANRPCIDIQQAQSIQVAMAKIRQAAINRRPPFDLIVAEQLPLVDPQVDNGTNRESDGGKLTTVPSQLSGAELLFHNLVDRDQVLLISVSPFDRTSNTVPVSTLSDLVWCKPPPRMDSSLRTQLIRTLQNKRNRHQNK